MLEDNVSIMCTKSEVVCHDFPLLQQNIKEKMLALCDLNQYHFCGFLWFSTCLIIRSDIHISEFHRFHKLLQVKIFSPIAMVLSSVCLKYFSKKNNFWQIATVQNTKSLVLFIARKFVDIVHDSKLFEKFRSCVVLFPAIITSIHIESAILMSLMAENLTDYMKDEQVHAVY